MTDIYPTLCELAKIPIPDQCDGKSLVKHLKNPNLISNQTSLTSFQFWGDKTPSHAVSDDKHRYIFYGKGFEELYDLEKDPHEFKNLASDENYSGIKNKLKKSIEQPALRNFLMKNIFRKDNIRFDFRFNLKSLSKNIDKIGEKVDSAEKFSGEVYFFKGSRSEYIMESDQDLIHKLFPKSKFIKIQNAGHWLHADNPNDFLSELLSLI